MPSQAGQSYEFGPFRFDPQERVLIRGGMTVPLNPKASELLFVLLENRGHLLDKNSLMERLWPDTHVEESNLTFTVHLVRTALGDGASGERYIETVPKRGYRFIAPVRLVEERVAERLQPGPNETGAVPPAPSVSIIRGAKRFRWSVAAGLSAAVAILGAAGILAFIWSSTPAPPKVTGWKQLTSGGRPKSVGGPLLTDGVRVFFYEHTTQGGVLSSVPIEGGEATPVSVPPDFQISDISSAGDQFLGSYISQRELERELWICPVFGGSLRRVGSVMSYIGSWAPDGRLIAYAKGDALYVVKSDGTESRKVATVPGAVSGIRWSPDGRVLRFQVRSLKELTLSLWEVASDGTNLHPLLPGWNNPAYESLGGWTPDAKYFLFSSLRNGREDIWAIQEGGRLFRTARREPVQIPAGPLEFEGVTASKDGKKLFAIGISRRNEVVRYDSRLGEFVPYLEGISAYWVTYSRDAQWMAYSTFPEEILWRSRPDGSKRLQLSFAPMHVVGLSWSPDGTRLAFRGQIPGKPWKLYVVSVDGGKAEELQTGESDTGIPTWSGDGTRLVFGDVPPVFGQAKGNEVLHVYDLRSHQISSVPGSQGLWTSRWSPDGRYIAALTIKSQELMLFDFFTQKWRSLGPQRVNEMAWSKNGQSIYFEDYGGDPGLFRLAIKSGKIKRLVNLNRLTRAWGGFTLAPDDSPILLRSLGTSEIYALDLEPR